MHRIVLTLLFVFGTALMAQEAPRFEVDPTWPKPLPGRWIFGEVGGICVDSHDHILAVDRTNITAEEKETNEPTPPFVMFDTTGAVVASWGDPNVVPASIHGCAFDRENNVFVGGNDDGIVQKYSHEGKLLLQIGKRGVFDTVDGTMKSPMKNSSHEQFNRPAGVAIDPTNDDIYVADGYGNRRVAVFDKTGKFLRQWGRQATQPEIEEGTGGAFAQVLHCVVISNAGLVYTCDRQGQRVQVTDKNGKLVRNIWIRVGTPELPKLPNPRGTAWWVAFSPDREQKYMYVMNALGEMVHVLDHASGKILSTFGRPGHQIGNFTHGHTIAVDSKGNLYVAETNWGRRVQRFKLVS
jgi:DNA-binding beta-propeller fold protein YncE